MVEPTSLLLGWKDSGYGRWSVGRIAPGWSR